MLCSVVLPHPLLPSPPLSRSARLDGEKKRKINKKKHPHETKRRDVFQDAYHSFMPSYQDYVVARDDIDPSTGGAARAAAATAPPTGGSEKQSRVVRTRTFLIGNLDRPTGEQTADGAEVGSPPPAPLPLLLVVLPEGGGECFRCVCCRFDGSSAVEGQPCVFASIGPGFPSKGKTELLRSTSTCTFVTARSTSTCTFVTSFGRFCFPFPAHISLPIPHPPPPRAAPQQSGAGEEKSADGSGEGGGGGGQSHHHHRNGTRRLDDEDEDLEGGLDEDWGQDVDVIELQNRLPDTTSTSSSAARGGKGKAKSAKSKAAAAAAAAAAEVAAAAVAQAEAEVAGAAGKSDSDGKGSARGVPEALAV